METTEGTNDGNPERGNPEHGRPVSEAETEAGRPVRVGYVSQGFGVALVVGEAAADAGAGEDVGGHDAGEPTDDEVVSCGLLRVGDAVVTLEIPLPGGGRSVLSWDPTEVALDPLVA